MIITLTEQNQIINIVLLTNDWSWGEKMVSDRKTDRAERKRKERRMKRVKAFSVWLYSPRRIGYRTLFYAAFVCAYACCPSAGRTHPAHAPSRGHVGSRTCLARSRVGSKSRAVLRVDPFLCRVPDLGWDPSACSLRSIFCQMSAARPSDCQSSDWMTEAAKKIRRLSRTATS